LRRANFHTHAKLREPRHPFWGDTDPVSYCNLRFLSLLFDRCCSQLRGGNSVKSRVLDFLRTVVRIDSSPESPAYVCILPSLQRPQAVVAHVETTRFPVKEVQLQSRDARGCVGRLALFRH